jgi:glycosyltransferase involved in cell wall biosynthesis
MKAPVVSVILPAYNSAEYIAETIESVLNQSFADFELIVIDDGSTDGQADEILPFCERDQRVRYIYQTNKGVSSARNTGFNHSSGKFIAFLDADDIWLPNNLEAKMPKFDEEDVGLVHSDAGLIDQNSKEITGKVMTGMEGNLLDIILEWQSMVVPGPSSILVRRKVLHTIGLFDTRLSTSADYDLFIRIAAKYRISRVPIVTWKYRLHDSNMHKNIKLMEQDVLIVYKKASINNLFKTKWFENRCYSIMYMILAASWAGDEGNYFRGGYYVCLALANHPYSIVDIYKRISKRWFFN